MRRGEIAVLSILACAIAAIVGSALPAQAVAVKPDRDFAGDGRTALLMPGHQFSTDVVIDGSTSYLVGDTPKPNSTKKYRMMIAKYGPAGHLDRSFGDQGRRYIQLGSNARAFSGALAPDGGILIVGWAQLAKPSVVIVKLRPNGAFDRDFGGDGVVRVAVDRGIDWPLVDSEPDGDIWLAWSSVRRFDYDEHDSDIRVMHFGPQGHVDRSFSGNGVRDFDIRKRDFTYFSTVDSTGRFYMAGFAQRSQRSVGVASVLSVSDSGRAFTRTVNPWGNDGAFPLTVDVDSADQVMLGLSPWRGPGWGAVRMTNDLALDKTYGNNGVARHDCACTSTSGALTDRGLVLVGNAQQRQQQTVIAHFSNTGRWDRQLGNSRYNLFSDWEYWVETEVDASQRLVLAGTVNDSAGGDMAIARMKVV
jgi:uncharacterized delta-60 repeat protein